MTLLQKIHDIVQNDLEEIANSLGDLVESFEGKTVLLTGGGGFLGYYLINYLLHANKTALKMPCRVVCVDNLIRGLPIWLKNLESNEDLEIITANILELDLCKLEPIDYIIHAASIASPTYYRQHPIETIDANVKGLWNLLDYCNKRQVNNKPIKSFLFFSSSEIYGDADIGNIPTEESYRGYVSCTGPRACYDESKRFGETLCVNFFRVYNVPVKIVRPFNNYGPGLRIDDRRVIPDFCSNILEQSNIVLLSSGSAKRTFCYIADAITGYLQILLSNHNGEAFNIGTETPEISMRELAELVIKVGEELFGQEGLKVIEKDSDDKDYLVDNPNRRCPSIKKAREMLGYSTKVELEEGLKRSLIWYKGMQLEGKKAIEQRQ